MNLTLAEYLELQARAPRGTLVRAAPNPALTAIEFDVRVPVRSRQHIGQRSWKPWAAYKRRWRAKTEAAATIVMLEQGWAHAPSVPKRVVFLAFVRSVLDDDHLADALVPARDGAKDAGLIHDDAPSTGHVFEYGQQLDRRRVGVRVRVEILPRVADSQDAPPERIDSTGGDA